MALRMPCPKCKLRYVLEPHCTAVACTWLRCRSFACDVAGYDPERDRWYVLTRTGLCETPEAEHDG